MYFSDLYASIVNSTIVIHMFSMLLQTCQTYRDYEKSFYLNGRSHIWRLQFVQHTRIWWHSSEFLNASKDFINELLDNTFLPLIIIGCFPSWGENFVIPPHNWCNGELFACRKTGIYMPATVMHCLWCLVLDT